MDDDRPDRDPLRPGGRRGTAGLRSPVRRALHRRRRIPRRPPGVPPPTRPPTYCCRPYRSAWGGGILTAYRPLGQRPRVHPRRRFGRRSQVRRLLLERYYVKAGVDRFGLRVVYGFSRFLDFVDESSSTERSTGSSACSRNSRSGCGDSSPGVVLDYAAYVVVGLVIFLVFLYLIVPACPALGGGEPWIPHPFPDPRDAVRRDRRHLLFRSGPGTSPPRSRRSSSSRSRSCSSSSPGPPSP